MVQTINIRKKPVQARSRARVDAILNAATHIIAENGSGGLKMSAVAARAGVPIGTVYQFFPNKNAIIHTLAQDSMEQVRIALIEKFADFKTLDDAIEKIAQSVLEYFRYFRQEPVIRDIWCSTQGDKLLQELDIEDSRVNGDILFENLKPFFDATSYEALQTMCFLSMQLTGAAVRLAITQDTKTANLILEQYIAMIRAQIRHIH